MPIGESHIFEIVMLPARAHTFLRRSCPRVFTLFQSQKDILELVHPRIGEQQSWIIGRDERRGVDLLMPMLDEVVQKLMANL